MRVNWLLASVGLAITTIGICGFRLIFQVRRERCQIDRLRRERMDHYLLSGLDPKKWEA